MSESFGSQLHSAKLEVIAEPQQSSSDPNMGALATENEPTIDSGENAKQSFRRRLGLLAVFGLAALVVCVAFALLVAGGLERDIEDTASADAVRADGTTSASTSVVRQLQLAKIPNASAMRRFSAVGGLSSMWPSNDSTLAAACGSPRKGDRCHSAVMWSMMDGILSNSEWYPGLDINSSFEEFQGFLHKGARANCAPPCPVTQGQHAAEWVPQIQRRRRFVDMQSCRRRHYSDYLPQGWDCNGDTVGPAKPPQDVPPFAGPYLNNYNGDNPLNVESKPQRSDNYFLIVGDWGKAFGVGNCQKVVAEKMKQYVLKYNQLGKKLLSIASVGDNFYWTGVTPDAWGTQWEAAYGANNPGSPLFEVPWIVTLGNHDYGDTDPFAFCPNVRPHHHIDGQPYGSMQLNRDRNPTRPEWTWMYWFPDYNFHYTIPEADLEFIVIDTNSEYVGAYRGCNANGFREACTKCGGWDKFRIFLQHVEAAGIELLKQRAQLGTAKTTVIIQHYPGECHRDEFLENLPPHRQGQVKVLCAFGHDHEQICTGTDADGQCNELLTGGGGGCCGEGTNRRGFTAVHLAEDGGYTLDVESDDVKVREVCWD